MAEGNGKAKGTAVTPRVRAKLPVFLDTLRNTGNVRLAATKAEVGRRTVYDLRARDADFAADWDEALEEAYDLMEAEAWRRAIKGVEEPVYYQGEVVGHVNRKSDTMLIFLMKAARPEKYREHHKVDVSGNVKHTRVQRVELVIRDTSGGTAREISLEHAEAELPPKEET